MSKKNTIKIKSEESETKIYCGPTIDGIVKTFTAFENGIIPNALSEAAKSCAAIEALTVPLSEIADIRRELNIAGTATSILYNSIDEFFKGGKKYGI